MTDNESNDDDDERGTSAERRARVEEQVGEADVEYDRQAPGDVVKGHFDVLEAEVVEGDHAHKHHCKAECFLGGVEVVRVLGELAEEFRVSASRTDIQQRRGKGKGVKWRKGTNTTKNQKTKKHNNGTQHSNRPLGREEHNE